MKIAVLPVLLLVAGVAGAQSTAPTEPAPPETAQVAAPFASWLGCWRLEGDVESAARLCITPDAPGVRLQTIVAGRLVVDEPLRGDGVARPIVEAGCEGTERTEWSRDKLRLFRYGNVVCGTGGSRSVSAILFLGRERTWVNVEMVGAGESRMLRVQRYRRIDDEEPTDGKDEDLADVADVEAAVGAADTPAEAGAAWTVEAVIEASRRMSPEALQAALTEAGGRFALDKKSLTALADAKVPASTIDLMIGLSYPGRFSVQRERTEEEPTGATDAEAGVAADSPVETGSPWDVEDVIEASRVMPAEVVQAALTEARGRFALDKKSLIALADAKVPEATIDLMIGLTYPKRFFVQRGGSSSTTGGFASTGGSYSPFFYWGSGYAGCTPHAYGYWSYYVDTACVDDYYDYYYEHGYDNGGWVPVEPGPPVPTERQAVGRVVNGRGYTQVWPRGEERSGSGGDRGGEGAYSASSGASTGTSSVSSSGYSDGYSSGSSSGNSNDSGDRVAVPRPPDR